MFQWYYILCNLWWSSQRKKYQAIESPSQIASGNSSRRSSGFEMFFSKGHPTVLHQRLITIFTLRKTFWFRMQTFLLISLCLAMKNNVVAVILDIPVVSWEKFSFTYLSRMVPDIEHLYQHLRASFFFFPPEKLRSGRDIGIMITAQFNSAGIW